MGIEGNAYCTIKRGHCEDYAKLAEQNEKMLKQLKLHCELCMFMNSGKCPDTIDCQTQTLIAEIEEEDEG
jgi:hypothetical protein